MSVLVDRATTVIDKCLKYKSSAVVATVEVNVLRSCTLPSEAGLVTMVTHLDVSSMQRLEKVAKLWSCEYASVASLPYVWL